MRLVKIYIHGIIVCERIIPPSKNMLLRATAEIVMKCYSLVFTTENTLPPSLPFTRMIFGAQPYTPERKADPSNHFNHVSYIQATFKINAQITQATFSNFAKWLQYIDNHPSHFQFYCRMA